MPHPQQAAAERCERRTGEPARAAEQALALRIELLGGFRVTHGERVVAEGAWRLAKARGLVKLLALAPGHRLTRERVLDLLWPDLDPEAAANNLRVALHAARRAFDAEPAASPLRLQHGVLALQPPGSLWVDVDAFEAAAAAARRNQGPADYQAAIDRYTGDLLPEDRYEDWAAGRREALRATYLALLVELAGLLEARGDYAPAIVALQRAVAEEPTHEEAHVGLMRLHALAGQRQQALRQYQRLRAALRQELDAEPDPASQRLYAEILGGRYPPGAPPGRPAPVSQGGRRHNLPAPLTRFIGRERELTRVKELLAGGPSGTRLVTLTGAGGSGKTRLALAVAAEIVACYPDGVWLVELAALQDPALVPGAVARALGVRDQSGRAPLDTLVDALRDKAVLLVLDNCEHLADACAHLAERLLSAGPRLQVLATSRAALRVPGEVTWTAPPLRMPDPRHPPTAEALAGSEAVELFVDRVRWRLPDFAVTEQNAPAVAAICRKLDGLPLAIELAAARVLVLAPEYLAGRLDDALRLLTGGSRTAPSRQQTLRATLDWSHALLDERERAVFRRLAVFAGGWTLAAAEAVCGDERVPGDDVLTLLAHLVDQSLVLAEAGEGEARYRLLETVRQYARERLQESGDVEAVRRRHALHFLGLAEAAEPELRGPGQVGWLDRLEADDANSRTAFDWLLDQEPELALRLAVALTRFWWLRGYMVAGRRRLEGALARAERADPWLHARALHNAGIAADALGDKDRAVACFEQALALFRQLGDRGRIASSLNSLGAVARSLGDLVRARAFLQESLEIRRHLGEQTFITSTLGNLAQVERDCADLTRALALWEEALALNRAVGNEAGIATTTMALGRAAWERGEQARARQLIEDGLGPARRVGDRELIAEGLEVLAAIGTPDDPVQAARLWGAAEQLREAISAPIPPADQPVYERLLADARGCLDEEIWQAGRSEGRAMTPEQAVECALGVARAAEAARVEAPATRSQPA